MRLFDAVLQANSDAPPGTAPVVLPADLAQSSAPVAALTCIDSRLNRLLPHRLGIGAEQFVWLRNAGNIITGPLSSTMRSLALACAIKGAREIAVIGHSDCQVCHSTVLKLTEGLRALGVERDQLPENLVDYFALFASERQNVIRAADTIRTSPLIGRAIPVHGLLLNVQDGRLEWVANGYHLLQNQPGNQATTPVKSEGPIEEAFSHLPPLGPSNSSSPASPALGTDSMSHTPLGAPHSPTPDDRSAKNSLNPTHPLHASDHAASKLTGADLLSSAGKLLTNALQNAGANLSPADLLDAARRFRVIGSDQKIYGPITGAKILQWIAEERIGWDSPSQAEGSGEWRPLAAWVEAAQHVLQKKPLPPRLPRT